jgi:signal transduction histidine kinase
MGFAAVARVTDERWIACAVRDEISFGLKPGGELKLETTICNEIRASGEGVVIDHVAEDEAFCGHPTPAMYGFQSYISMPIVRPGGAFFGTLCAIDPRPASLKRPEVAQMFRLFADLIAFYLDADERMAATEAALLDERQAAELREQFIAVLGHDLRNPLASIDAGVRMLQKEALGGRGPAIVRLVQSSVSRMAELIDNVLDFARGRLGGGLKLDLNAEARLRPVLEQVVAELTHGAPNAPVRVSASSDGDVFALSVENKGEPIPPGTVDRLFQPFFRGAGRTGQQGLGLGLYIAAEIARAHDGTLTVASSPERTRFTLRMPRGEAGE